MSKEKGYGSYAKGKKLLPVNNDIEKSIMTMVEEFPTLQKAAYEASQNAQVAEKLSNGATAISMGANEIVCGLVNLLKDKGIILEEDLDEYINVYRDTQQREINLQKIKGMGYSNPIEKVVSKSLVDLNFQMWDHTVNSDDEKLAEEEAVHSKDYFVISDGNSPFFFGIEKEINGLKVDESKTIIHQMPEKEDIQESIRGKKVTIIVTVRSIWEKNGSAKMPTK